MILRNILLAATAALMASACATKPYVPTVYDPVNANVESIAIADDVVKDKLAANELSSNMGTGQAAGGLIGLLVVAAIEGAETSSRKDRLAEVMEPVGFDAETVFQEMMAEKLKAGGFTGGDIVGGLRSKNAPLEKFPETDADAILDVSMTNFGIQKAKTGDPWRPAAGVFVQLVSSDDNTLLMENQISYNSGLVGAKEGVIQLQPQADSVGYMKVKEIDAEDMAAQMTDMIDEITDTIMTLLK